MNQSESRFRKVFPIIDAMVDHTARQLAERGTPLRCGKGCTHCCYLLVEVVWEEAVELASWIKRQPPARRQRITERVKASSADARRLFRRWRSTKKFTAPLGDDSRFPEWLYDRYFDERPRPCPFLENGACAAYAVRPTPCRLHAVTSAPDLCSRDARDDSGFRVPRLLEKTQREAGPVIAAMSPDPRVGHLGIMVEAALAETERVKPRRATRTNGALPRSVRGR